MIGIKLTAKGFVAGFLMCDEKGPKLSLEEANAMADAFLEAAARRGMVFMPFDKKTGKVILPKEGE